MSSGGVSYYTSYEKHVVINIPYWEENKENKDIFKSQTPSFEMGEICEECLVQLTKKRKKEHNCIYEKGSYHPMRIYTKEKLLRIIDDFKKAVNCERGIFNYCVQYNKSKNGIAVNWKNKIFKENYKSKALSVIFNLSNKKNPKLLEKVKSGEILSHKIPFMKPRELFPEKWEGMKPGMYTIVFERKEDIPDSIIQCGKCKSRKVHYYQLQTRSADEPMTTFCTCMNCDKKWKF